ncbi:MAG: AI-2E family transporter, partial [Spirochaetia bacterium]|nr:AI-2E family transporter [Spirochaetia bacterium]
VSLEVADGYDNFRKSEFYGAFTSKSIVEKMKKLPLLHNQWHRLEELNLDQKLEQNVDTALQVIFQWTRKILVSTSTFFLQLLITLYLIYFFLLDGEKWGRRAYELLPIKYEDSDKIFFETMRVVQGALLGSVVVGIIEGVWGGLVFAAIGIPSPAIWGLVMTILSILPVVGSNTILIPFGLYMLATGHYGKAVVILVIGSGLITITTGLLKPKLVGDRAGLHPAMIVLSTLGGVAWLGMVGFFIGPLLAALFFMIWVQFSERYKKHLGGIGEPRATSPSRKRR